MMWNQTSIGSIGGFQGLQYCSGGGGSGIAAICSSCFNSARTLETNQKLNLKDPGLIQQYSSYVPQIDPRLVRMHRFG